VQPRWRFIDEYYPLCHGSTPRSGSGTARSACPVPLPFWIPHLEKTTRAEERSRDDPPAEVHTVHFSDTSMSQHPSLDGLIKLADHQRRISGTEMNVGEYTAAAPAPKAAPYHWWLRRTATRRKRVQRTPHQWRQFAEVAARRNASPKWHTLADGVVVGRSPY